MRTTSMKSIAAAAVLAIGLAVAAPLQAATTRPTPPPSQTTRARTTPGQKLIKRIILFFGITLTDDGELINPKP